MEDGLERIFSYGKIRENAPRYAGTTMPMPTTVAELTNAQSRAIQAILAATVKKSRSIRVQKGDSDPNAKRKAKEKTTKVWTIIEFKKRAWVGETRLIEAGHSLETLESLEAETRESVFYEVNLPTGKNQEKVTRQEKTIREENGWLIRWKRGEIGSVWTLTPFAAHSLAMSLGEHWEYTSTSRPRKSEDFTKKKTKTKQPKSDDATTPTPLPKKADMVKVRVTQEVAEWRTEDPLNAPKGTRPIRAPRYKGECELADWVGDEQPSREMSPEDQAIAAEEVAMQDAVKDDGRLDIDEGTQKVRREPVTLWGKPIPIDRTIKGKRTATGKSKKAKSKAGKKTVSPDLLADRPGATVPCSGVGDVVAGKAGKRPKTATRRKGGKRSAE